MFNSDYAIIRIYNNGNADIVLENKTIYTTKDNAYGYIMAARQSMKEVAWNRYENDDQTYWFN